MTRVLKIGLPFVLTFVLGVACTAIVRSVWPSHRTFSFRERSRCNWKSTSLSPRPFKSMQSDLTDVEVVELHEGARVNHFKVQVPRAFKDDWGLKERTLLGSTSNFSSDSTRVISYFPPEAIDGQPVSSNVAISYIPAPRFWQEQNRRNRSGCNAMVRVEFHASGKVSSVVTLPGYAEGCPYIEDFFEAAEGISFRPALRHGVPVTQRTSIFYRSN